MNSDIIAMQQDLFSRLATSIPTDWRRIVMSYEQEQSSEGLKQSLVLFYVRKTPDGLTTINLTDASGQVADSLAALNKAMSDQSGHAWSTFDLTIDNDGHCNANLPYDPPKRINGVFDEQSSGRYHSYLETYGKDLEVTDAPGTN